MLKVYPMACNSPIQRPALVQVRIVGDMTPKKGEYYVSGAIPEIYKAPNDLGQIHRVVEPLFYMESVQVTQRGKPFTK